MKFPNVLASQLHLLVVVVDDVIYLLQESGAHHARVTGQPSPPCSAFTLTPVGERRAALFGGMIGPKLINDDLLIVELTKHTVVSV